MNVVRMKVRLLRVVVDERLDSLGSQTELPHQNGVANTDFWIYREGGPRSRRWSLTEPKAPGRIGQGANDARVPTSRPSVTSGPEQSA